MRGFSLIVTGFFCVSLEGNDVYGPKFNLGFGGRRKFCDTEYADLGKYISPNQSSNII